MHASSASIWTASTQMDKVPLTSVSTHRSISKSACTVRNKYRHDDDVGGAYLPFQNTDNISLFYLTYL